MNVSVQIGIRGAGEVGAQRGGSHFVEVEWSSTTRDTADPLSELAGGTTLPVQLRLTAGGWAVVVDDSVDLRALGVTSDESRSEVAVVAFSGDGDDMRLSATYAGREQSVAPLTGQRR